MLGLERHSASDAIGRRIAALKDDLDHLQSALRRHESGWEKAASQAQDWLAERAEALPRLDLEALRQRVLPAHAPALRDVPPVVPVIAAAVAVGVGVGCVLYAVTSRGRRRSASVSAKGAARRSSSKP